PHCAPLLSDLALSILLSIHSLFTPPPPPQISTLSLHDALPISVPWSKNSSKYPMNLPESSCRSRIVHNSAAIPALLDTPLTQQRDRKSTRLNSSHVSISYAVFCLKKKKKITRL